MKKFRKIVAVALMLSAMTLPALAEATAAESPMLIDLTGIAQTVIVLLASLIYYKLKPWIKARTTADQQAALNVAARTLVFAAEQLYQGDKQGAQRLRYVQEGLRKKGFNIDIDAIEAAVMELKLEEVSVIELEQALALDVAEAIPYDPDN